LDTGTVLVSEVSPPAFPSPQDNPPLESPNLVINHDTFRYEQKKVASSSSTKIRSGTFSTEQTSANAAQVKRLHTGDGIKFEQKQSAQAMRHKVETDGFTAEKSAALKQEQR